MAGVDDSADQAIKKEDEKEQQLEEKEDATSRNDSSQCDLANTTKDISLVDRQVDDEMEKTGLYDS